MAYKSPNEYAWAAFLQALKLEFKYEALEADLSRAIRYQPDFWLPGALIWLEIKPLNHALTPGEIRVAWQLLDATKSPVYVACGWSAPQGLRLWVFSRDCPAPQEAASRLAFMWLGFGLKRGLFEMIEASKIVMARRMEFVKEWQKDAH